MERFWDVCGGDSIKEANGPVQIDLHYFLAKWVAPRSGLDSGVTQARAGGRQVWALLAVWWPVACLA